MSRLRAPGVPGCDHGMVEDGLNDRLPQAQRQRSPLLVECVAGAGEVVEGGDLGDPIAGLLDTGGDRVSGGDPLPRGDSPIGVQFGQLIEAALVSVQLGGQVSNVVIQAGSPGHGIGEVPGFQPGQYRVGHQLFDGFSDDGQPTTSALVGAFQSEVAPHPVVRVVVTGLGEQPVAQRPQRSIPESR